MVISFMLNKDYVGIMKTCTVLVLFFSCSILAHREKKVQESPSPNDHSRVKRSAVGALHIMTNHAQPIHADVKSENDGTEKPCPEGSSPSHIEPGAGFQVTPPEESQYAMKSLRKSLPLHYVPTTLDLVRSISRIITLMVLFISAVFEFYPTIQALIMTIHDFFSSQ